MRKVVIVISLVLLFLASAKQADAYLLYNTDCDFEDPDYAGPTYCRDRCIAIVGSIPGVAQWCDRVSGICSSETNLDETTNICRCLCRSPVKDIQCVDNSSIPVGGGPSPDCNLTENEKCIAGSCETAGSNTCNPLLSGADCWLPEGPCDPEDPAHDIAYCADEDMDGSGVCYCSTDDYLGLGRHNEVFCDSNGIPSHEPNPNWLRLSTAIGCIPLTIEGSEIVNVIYLVEFFIEWGVGMAGGLALFLIILGSVQVMTSAGDPQKAQAGRELVTAAVSGTLLLIFGVFILRIIGINILGIPGL